MLKGNSWVVVVAGPILTNFVAPFQGPTAGVHATKKEKVRGAEFSKVSTPGNPGAGDATNRAAIFSHPCPVGSAPTLGSGKAKTSLVPFPPRSGCAPLPCELYR